MADYMRRRPDLIVCGEGVVHERILLYSIDGSETSLVQNGHFSSTSASKRTSASQENIVDSTAKSSLSVTDSCDSLTKVDNSVYDVSDFSSVEPRATPSYLKLSRAVGGYAPYNAYTSVTKHERLRTDSNVAESKLQLCDKRHQDSEVILRNGDPVVTVKQPHQTSVYGSTERHPRCDLLDRCGDTDTSHVSAGNNFRSSSSSFVLDRESHQSVSSSVAFSGSSSAACHAVPSVKILPPAVLEGCQANVVALHNGTTNWCNESNKKSSFLPISNDLEDPETSQKDGQYFLNLVDIAEKRLKLRCDRTELDLQAETSDEAEGRMRAAIGKANLLIQKKFPQFRQLCHANLHQKEDDPFKTTDQDLSGFWDMVLIQVEDVDKQFEGIEQLRENGWKEIKTLQEILPESVTPSAKPSAKIQKRCSITNVRPAAASSSTSAGKAREEARKRLMAAKAAGRQRKASESDKDIEIFVS